MRLIDAESLIQNAEDVLTWDMLARINAEETVDIVKHGHWIQNHNTMTCSVCNRSREANHHWWSYCPNCGSRMDEEQEEKSVENND